MRDEAQDMGNTCRGLGYGLRLQVTLRGVSFIRAAVGILQEAERITDARFRIFARRCREKNKRNKMVAHCIRLVIMQPKGSLL